MIEELIRTGKLAWYAKWKTKDTSILLILHGDRGELAFEISYSSIALSRLEKKPPL